MTSVFTNIVSLVNSVSRRLIGRSISKQLLVACCWLLVTGGSLFGQTNGDYRSKASGSWSNLSTWEIYVGSWNQPTALQGYPGQSSSPSRVTIYNNVTLDVDLANTSDPRINNLSVISGTLELGAFNFVVNGTTNISGILSDNNIGGVVAFHGTITVANTGTWTSNAFPSSQLLFYADIINNSNSVSVSHARAAANIILSGTGTIVMNFFEFNGPYTVTNQTTITINQGLNQSAVVGSAWINEGILNYASTTDLLMSPLRTLDASYPGNTVNYSGSGAQDIKTPLSSYYNLSTSGSGTKTMLNNLVIGGNLNIGTSTTLNSNTHDLTISGNWTNNGAFTEGSRRVTFNGTNNQTITNPSNETFYNLTINNSGGSGNNNLILSNTVTCSNSLTMTSGNINTGSNVMVLSPTSVGSLIRTSGTIIGRFTRGVITTGGNYLFPVGTASYYRPAIFNFASLASATNITAQFLAASPGAFTPYLDDGVNQLDFDFTDGYWSFSSSGLPATTYTLSLDGDGFSSFAIDANSRISGRNAGAPLWSDYGTHGTVDIPNSTITRTGINILNSTSFDYCFAGRCNVAASAGPDRTICEGSSATLNGSGGGTYSWSPSYGLSNPNIANPVASPAVTTTYTLTVTNGTCVNTDNVVVTVNPAPAVALGYAFQKSITIDHNLVNGGSDLMNFPVLVNISNSPERDQLRTVVNGGHVQNSNGYDIIFTDANSNKLDHQVESYDPATGNLIVWVRLPVLSATVNTTIQMLYGNPQISTDPSVKSVWDPNFRGVWHLNATDYSDGTLNANNGTNFGSTDAAGQIGFGKSFNGTTDYINAGNNTSLFINNSITVSAWVNSVAGGDGHIINMGGGWARPGYSLFWYLGNIRDELQNTGTPEKLFTDVAGPSTGFWHYIAFTWDIGSTSINTYIDGVLQSPINPNTFIGPIGNPIQNLIIGKNEDPAAFGLFNGVIDEARVQSISRPAGWIVTEYNNQKSPSTFYSISGESNCSLYDFEVCSNATGVIYSVPAQANQTYNWSITGASGFTGNGTNQVSVNWGAAGTGQISLSITNTTTGCSTSSPVYSVIKNPAPAPVITGNLTVCPDKPNEIYSTANISGHSYAWTVTGDVSFTGDGTNQINVDWGPGPIGTVSLVETITASGCNTSENITINILDNTPPTVTCPGIIAQNVDAGTCNASVVVSNAVIADNCSLSSLTWSMTGATVASSSGSGINQVGTYTFNAGITTVTYIVKDGTGNQANCNFTVTITDNINPTITCPANITHTADAGLCSYTVAVGVPTTGDNCGVSGTVGTRSDALLLTDPYPVGVTTIHWVVTDIHANTNSCDQTVTVTDNEIPAIICPADVTVSCEDDNTPAGTGTATATDNCTPAANITITFSDVSTYSIDPANVLHYNYVITRTWRAADVATNFIECTQTITVHDITNPVITCPVDITISCDASSLPANTGTATATDNCDPAPVITHSDVSTYSIDPANVLHYNYVITRTWRATDVATNFIECIQTITVHDVTNPVIDCPVDVTVSCEDDNTPAGTGAATATDNCAPSANIAITFSDVSTYSVDPANVLHYNYVITRTWRATDVATNFIECTQTITVHDITNPVITCPVDVTVSCEDDNTPAATGTATATDNCDSAPAISYSDVSTYSIDPTNVLHYNYVITRTWRATDVATNFIECTQTITVHDITKPVITCPEDITISCDASSLPANTGTATATDNCDPAPAISYSDVSTYGIDPANVLHYNYVITRTWRATDVATNFIECTQTITVHDITNPVITCPADITISCDASSLPANTGTATATDNCDPAPAISYSDVSTYSIDPANVLHYNYVITRTWRAADVATNFIECTQTITVHDITNPVITCPVDITISCDASSLPANTGTATATDNCDPAPAISYSDVSTYSIDPANVLHYNYVITRTWRATDVATNFIECTQTITVHDITNPVITCPVDVTVSCEDDNTPAATGTATATDNCAPSANIAITFSDVSTYSVDPANVLHYNYVITRTWRATDVATNFIECTQTITVHDITNPVITCPVDVTVSCEDDNTPAATGTATATDNCDSAPAISYSDVSTYSIDPVNILHYNYVITRTWRATDVATNFIECTQTITVHDITNPVITCPVDITISCDASSLPANTGTATATDNCDPAPVISYSDVSTYSIDPANVLHYNYVISRTWRATDVATNFIECTQTITVHDITNPVITCPVDITISCDASSLPANTGTATATDNCDPAPVISYSDVSTYSIDPANVLHYNYVITRTWRATDVATNFIECTQTITVHDITNPVITCPVDITDKLRRYFLTGQYRYSHSNG